MSNEFDGLDLSGENENTDSFDLSDMGLEDAPTNPNFVADGKYPAVLDNIKPYTKDGARKLIFTYEIDDENSQYNGRKIQVWRDIVRKPASDATAKEIEFYMSRAPWLKNDLMTLGVPEDQLSSFDIKTLEGTPVYVTIKNNGDFTNVKKLESRHSSLSKGKGLDF